MHILRGFRRGAVVFLGSWLLILELALPGASVATETGWPLPHGGEAILIFGGVYAGTEGQDTTHRGVDIAGDSGEDVLAPFSGEVRFAGRVPASAGGTLLAITILRSDGVSMTFLPLTDLCVGTGDAVSAGDRIAGLEAAGDASSPDVHLHVGARRGDLYIDPMQLLVAPTALTSEPPQEPVATGEPVGTAAAGERGLQVPHTTSAAAPRLMPAPGVAPQPGVSQVAAPQVSAAPAAPLATVVAPITSDAALDAAHSRTDGTYAAAFEAGWSPFAAPNMAIAPGRAQQPASLGLRLPPAASVASAVRRVGRAWLLALLGSLAGGCALWPLWRRPIQSREEEPRRCITPEGTSVAAAAGR